MRITLACLLFIGVLALSCNKSSDNPRATCSNTIPVATCSDTTDDYKTEMWPDTVCVLNPNNEVDSLVQFTSGFIRSNYKKYSKSQHLSIPGFQVSVPMIVTVSIECYKTNGSSLAWGNLAVYDSQFDIPMTNIAGFENGCYRFYYKLYSQANVVVNRGFFDIEITD